MPRYEITAPDGKRYEITAPEGATQEQVLAYAQQSYGKPDFSKVRGSAQTAEPAPLEIDIRGGTPEREANPSLFRSDSDFRKQSGVGMGDMLWASAKDMFGGRNSAAEYLAKESGGTVGQDADGSPVVVLPSGQRYRLNDAGADMTDVANVAGNVAAFALPASWAARAGQARNLALGGRAALQAGAAGATDAALQGATNGGQVDLGRSAMVAAGGAGGEVVGAGLRGLAARGAQDPIRTQAIDTARQAGIPLHISQLSQSIPVKTLASTAKYLPLSGAGKAAQRQQGAFNRAVGRTFGAEADQLSDEVMAGARKNLGRQYQDLYRGRQIAASDDLVRRLAEINNRAAQDLTDDQAKVVSKQLDKIIDKAANGSLTGEQYQALRTSLGDAASDNATGRFIKMLRKELDDAAALAMSPADAAKLKQTQGQWANMRTAEGVLKQVAGAGGDIRPAALWPAIRNGSTKEMRELGRLGQLLLKDPIPDSGTAGRLLTLTGLGGVGVGSGGSAVPGLLGLLAGGATVGRALNSPAAANMLLGTQKAIPAGAKSLARVAPASGALVVSQKKRRDERHNRK